MMMSENNPTTGAGAANGNVDMNSDGWGLDTHLCFALLIVTVSCVCGY